MIQLLAEGEHDVLRIGPSSFYMCQSLQDFIDPVGTGMLSSSIQSLHQIPLAKIMDTTNKNNGYNPTAAGRRVLPSDPS